MSRPLHVHDVIVAYPTTMVIYHVMMACFTSPPGVDVAMERRTRGGRRGAVEIDIIDDLLRHDDDDET